MGYVERDGHIERETSVCAHNYSPLPVVLTAGCGVWLTDVGGKRHLDMMSAYSAVNVGHAHPHVLAAMNRQASRLAVTSRAYHNDVLGPFLERLTRIAKLDMALPMNTGAEAVETAIKAARRWGHRVKRIPEGEAEIVVARDNFHGRTTTIVGFSSDPSYRDGFGPFAPGFREIPFGDADALEGAITPRTAALLIEPIQGEAGIVVPPDGYLARLRAICDRYDVLLVLDEIQSGLGRTGRWFAHEHEDVRPDGLILGKALGGGVYPVSAFLATRELMNVFDPGSHGSTFGGNALAAAIGMAALDVIENEGLVENSAVLGEYLLRELTAMRSNAVREVRGRGLWVGVDVDPAVASARDLCLRLADAGVLTKDTHETVLRFAPPLTINREELDWGLDRIRRVFADAAAQPPRRAQRTPAGASEGTT